MVAPLGCAHHNKKPAQGTAVITGTVSYPGVVPAGASLTVHLVENTWTSQMVEVLATDTLNFQDGPPVPYSIIYNPAEVEEENRYSLAARATLPDGRVILRSNAYMVLTRGNPTNNVNIQMVPFGPNR